MIFLKTIRDENSDSLNKRFNELISVLEGKDPESSSIYRPEKIIINDKSYMKDELVEIDKKRLKACILRMETELKILKDMPCL